jgi:hypothetical protein
VSSRFDDDDDDADRVVDATEAALRAESWAPIKVIVIAEVLNAAGNRMLVEAASDMPVWDAMGLLHHALSSAELAAGATTPDTEV